MNKRISDSAQDYFDTFGRFFSFKFPVIVNRFVYIESTLVSMQELLLLDQVSEANSELTFQLANQNRNLTTESICIMNN